MEKISMEASRIHIVLDKKELDALVDPIIRNAEQFSGEVLDMAYLLAEESYRMENDFGQPPHAFG